MDNQLPGARLVKVLDGHLDTGVQQTKVHAAVAAASCTQRHNSGGGEQVCGVGEGEEEMSKDTGYRRDGGRKYSLIYM